MSTKESHCHSVLLKAIRPFHWLLALFIAAPPPCLTFDRLSHRCNGLLGLIYAFYALGLLFLTVWMTYTNNIVSAKIVESFKLGSLTNVLSLAQSVAVFFVQVFNQLIGILRFQQLLHIFVLVEQLEHDIRWQSLLTRMDAADRARQCERSFRWQLIRKSGCLLIFTTFFHTYTHYSLGTIPITTTERWLTAFTSTIIQMKSVEFCLLVQLVHALLQKLLDDLSFVRTQLTSTEQKPERYYLYVALQSNQQWLARVWNLVNAMESYYALPMLVLFLYDGLAITNTVNWAYINQTFSKDKIHNTYRLAFTANLLINMLVPCWLCQSCIQLYDRFANVLHDMRSDGSDVRLSMCLREYSLQLMHQKLLFSCDGFFDINLKHFGGRILTITTYVVILIQFRLQAEAEAAHEENLIHNWKLNRTDP